MSWNCRISHHFARTGNLYHIAIAEETTISTRKIFYNIGPSSIFHHFPIFANGITLKQIPGDQGDPSSDPKSQPKHLTRCRRWSPFMSVYVQLQWTKMDQAFWKCFDVFFLCWRSMFLHPNICWCSCMFFFIETNSGKDSLNERQPFRQINLSRTFWCWFTYPPYPLIWAKNSRRPHVALAPQFPTSASVQICSDSTNRSKKWDNTTNIVIYVILFRMNILPCPYEIYENWRCSLVFASKTDRSIWTSFVGTSCLSVISPCHQSGAGKFWKCLK